MLFNTAEFIFFFLPICLALVLGAARLWGNGSALWVLVLCSLFFYGWWNPYYLPLLIFSILFNFYMGRKIADSKNKPLLVISIAINLSLLIYYKYANFFIDNINLALDEPIHLSTIILPLAISFFTFQQIAYLVDSYQGITKEYSFRHYALFVSFFPQLIAGPIVHHKEMLPQFERKNRFKLNPSDVAIGLSIFAIGLIKKTVLADGIARYATPVFQLAETGESIDFFLAWGGALAYTFQLYFDFSGYSDMAIGLARIFGIVLPLNFYSPYKATSITEFWRRWHMTLSRFLRDYIYIPLGGNAKGPSRRYVNLITTMLLGGMWHGAGWNFLIWGALHGGYLTINHAWRHITEPLSQRISAQGWYVFLSWLITFCAVVVGWVFFRAVSFDGAINILSGMAGLNGFEIPNALMARLGGISHYLAAIGIVENQAGGQSFILMWFWNIILLVMVVTLPTVQDLFYSVRGSLSSLHYVQSNTFWPFRKHFQQQAWQASSRWAVVSGVSFALGVLTLTQVSEFLYFQF
ncbi:MBOAT family protein [Vibrio sp. Of7-15]|uniref:MBOAT family O-acyltransferase n=1 Tax=Vibrio sp. Of7-15 TaxID=2724879 RepID=UPI001EF38935|nr:MBOAT family protein [Vibrio sp. Of7-15]MCG7497217.1 MBOAT family protein [Vibrio sp. Of7-15]